MSMTVDCSLPQSAPDYLRRAAASFNHALQRTRRERRGCNRCIPCAGPL